MKIVFIGSGNVATHLAIALKDSLNEITQIYSPTLENAKLLAGLVDADPINNIRLIDLDADIYIISVKDDAISEVIGQMPKTKGIWVHTSGSIPMELFSSNKSIGFGVFYPLQTFSKNRKVDFSEVPVFIEGDSNETIKILKELAINITQKIYILNSDKRRYLHLAAVFANNFSNHMFTLASELLIKENIQFDVIKPLIKETAAKVMDLNPKDAQTGPAIRFDESVIKSHLDLINDSTIKEIYSLLSKSIHKQSLNKENNRIETTKGDL